MGQQVVPIKYRRCLINGCPNIWGEETEGWYYLHPLPEGFDYRDGIDLMQGGNVCPTHREAVDAAWHKLMEEVMRNRIASLEGKE